MRKIYLLLAMVLWPVFFAKADETNNEAYPAGMIYFQGADVTQVLDLYQKISGLELNIPDEVHRAYATRTIKYISKKPLSRAEAQKELERVLSEQADLVITKTDDKHAKVTLKEEKKEKPTDH